MMSIKCVFTVTISLVYVFGAPTPEKLASQGSSPNSNNGYYKHVPLNDYYGQPFYRPVFFGYQLPILQPIYREKSFDTKFSEYEYPVPNVYPYGQYVYREITFQPFMSIWLKSSNNNTTISENNGRMDKVTSAKLNLMVHQTDKNLVTMSSVDKNGPTVISPGKERMYDILRTLEHERDHASNQENKKVQLNTIPLLSPTTTVTVEPIYYTDNVTYFEEKAYPRTIKQNTIFKENQKNFKNVGNKLIKGRAFNNVIQESDLIKKNLHEDDDYENLENINVSQNINIKQQFDEQMITDSKTDKAMADDTVTSDEMLISLNDFKDDINLDTTTMYSEIKISSNVSDIMGKPQDLPISSNVGLEDIYLATSANNFTKSGIIDQIENKNVSTMVNKSTKINYLNNHTALIDGIHFNLTKINDVKSGNSFVKTCKESCTEKENIKSINSKLTDIEFAMNKEKPAIINQILHTLKEGDGEIKIMNNSAYTNYSLTDQDTSSSTVEHQQTQNEIEKFVNNKQNMHEEEVTHKNEFKNSNVSRISFADLYYEESPNEQREIYNAFEESTVHVNEIYNYNDNTSPPSQEDLKSISQVQHTRNNTQETTDSLIYEDVKSVIPEHRELHKFKGKTVNEKIDYYLENISTSAFNDYEPTDDYHSLIGLDLDYKTGTFTSNLEITTTSTYNDIFSSTIIEPRGTPNNRTSANETHAAYTDNTSILDSISTDSPFNAFTEEVFHGSEFKNLEITSVSYGDIGETSSENERVDHKNNVDMATNNAMYIFGGDLLEEDIQPVTTEQQTVHARDEKETDFKSNVDHTEINNASSKHAREGIEMGREICDSCRNFDSNISSYSVKDNTKLFEIKSQLKQFVNEGEIDFENEFVNSDITSTSPIIQGNEIKVIKQKIIQYGNNDNVDNINKRFDLETTSNTEFQDIKSLRNKMQSDFTNEEEHNYKIEINNPEYTSTSTHKIFSKVERQNSSNKTEIYLPNIINYELIEKIIPPNQDTNINLEPQENEILHKTMQKKDVFENYISDDTEITSTSTYNDQYTTPVTRIVDTDIKNPEISTTFKYLNLQQRSHNDIKDGLDYSLQLDISSTPTDEDIIFKDVTPLTENIKEIGYKNKPEKSEITSTYARQDTNLSIHLNPLGHGIVEDSDQSNYQENTSSSTNIQKISNEVEEGIEMQNETDDTNVVYFTEPSHYYDPEQATSITNDIESANLLNKDYVHSTMPYTQASTTMPSDLSELSENQTVITEKAFLEKSKKYLNPSPFRTGIFSISNTKKNLELAEDMEEGNPDENESYEDDAVEIDYK